MSDHQHPEARPERTAHVAACYLHHHLGNGFCQSEMLCQCYSHHHKRCCQYIVHHTFVTTSVIGTIHSNTHPQSWHGAVLMSLSGVPGVGTTLVIGAAEKIGMSKSASTGTDFDPHVPHPQGMYVISPVTFMWAIHCEIPTCSAPTNLNTGLKTRAPSAQPLRHSSCKMFTR